MQPDLSEMSTTSASAPSVNPSNPNLAQMAYSHLTPSFSAHIASLPSRDGHDPKRIKIEPSPPSSATDVAFDPLIQMQFDDDASKFEDFEIDYSKLYNPASEARSLTPSMTRLDSAICAKPSTSSNTAAYLTEEDIIDDSAFDHSLSDEGDTFDCVKSDEPMLDFDPQSQMEPQPFPTARDNFYSIPLSWDKPQLAMQLAMQPATMGMDDNAWDALGQTTNYSLAPEEQRRLLEIAMGPASGQQLLAYVPPIITTNPTSNNNTNINDNIRNSMADGYPVSMMPQNPLSQQFGIGNDPNALRLPTERLRRKSPGIARVSETLPPPLVHSDWDLDVNSNSNSQQPEHDVQHNQPPAASRRTAADPGASRLRSADRIAHNDVERKYRTNLKDKITELRNAVPALRQAYETESSSSPTAVKVSKGTVLTKATEYIRQLEQRNKDIMTEHQQLMRRLQAFETMVNSSMRSTDMLPSHSITLFDPRGFC